MNFNVFERNFYVFERIINVFKRNFYVFERIINVFKRIINAFERIINVFKRIINAFDGGLLTFSNGTFTFSNRTLRSFPRISLMTLIRSETSRFSGSLHHESPAITKILIAV